jgi:hypothetical protein
LAAQVASAIDRLERRIRGEIPIVRHVYVEAESLASAG